MTGRYEQLGFTRRPRQQDRDAVGDALARVELTDYRHRQIGRLSGGLARKRAFVARGIRARHVDPAVPDEPFAGVDKRTKTTITAQLRSLAWG